MIWALEKLLAFFTKSSMERGVNGLAEWKSSISFMVSGVIWNKIEPVGLRTTLWHGS